MKNEENRFIVKSTPAAGFQGKWRAGRRWDKGGVEVEIVDQDADPVAEPGDECLRIGRDTFRALQEDDAISVSPKGLNISNLKELEKSLADATTAHAELQKAHEELQATHAAAAKSLDEALAEVTKLQAEVADLKETVAALAEAPKAEAKPEAPKAKGK